jgi:phospholipid/cholesterol/gamma-HCH transport system substrate-binding protein
MSRESHLEVKVGSFVVIAILALAFFVASVTDLSFMEKGRSMQAIFTFANGLREASPVRLAGVEAGRVKELEIYVDKADGHKTKIKVNIWIKAGVEIPEDSQITINQLGLLGEKYIEIVPGSSTKFAEADTVFIGVDPLPMEKITERVGRMSEKLEKTVDGFNEIIGHVKKGEGTVGRLFMDDSIYKNLDELTVDLKSNPWKLLYRPKTAK